VYPSETKELERRIGQVRALLGPNALHGASAAEIEAAERRLARKVPDDARALVTAFDGSTEPTPVEHGWVTFWPIERWSYIQYGSQVSESLRHGVVFADYSDESFRYVLNLGQTDRPSPVHLITGTVARDRLVTSSLSEFLQAILDDDECLYPRD